MVAPTADNLTSPLPEHPRATTLELPVAGVVLDQAALLQALRVAIPRATGITPLSNGAYYAVLLAPEPGPAP